MVTYPVKQLWHTELWLQNDYPVEWLTHKESRDWWSLWCEVLSGHQVCCHMCPHLTGPAICIRLPASYSRHSYNISISCDYPDSALLTYPPASCPGLLDDHTRPAAGLHASPAASGLLISNLGQHAYMCVPATICRCSVVCRSSSAVSLALCAYIHHTHCHTGLQLNVLKNWPYNKGRCS